jgi:hypothetical protein
MKIITLAQDLNLSNTADAEFNLQFKPDIPYIMPDYLVAEFESKQAEIKQRLIKKTLPIDNNMTLYNGQNLDGKALVLIRYGGIGDLIFLTPFARWFKKQFNCKLILICATKYHKLFERSPYYEGVFQAPAPLEVIKGVLGYPPTRNNTFYISLEGLIELDPDAEVMNVYDLLNTKFNIGVPADELHPELPLDEDLTFRLRHHFELNDPKYLNIGYQFTASAPSRTLKPMSSVKFLNSWIIPNTRFFILDSGNRQTFVKHYLKEVNNPNVEIIPFWGNSLDQVVSLASSLDLMIGPDSSMLHMAGCFNTPMVGLFGAFHTDLRLSKYNKVLALDAMSDCKYAKGVFKGCYTHETVCQLASTLGRTFPPCMDLFDMTSVVKETVQFLKKLGLISKEDLSIIKA